MFPASVNPMLFVKILHNLAGSEKFNIAGWLQIETLNLMHLSRLITGQQHDSNVIDCLWPNNQMRTALNNNVKPSTSS